MRKFFTGRLPESLALSIVILMLSVIETMAVPPTGKDVLVYSWSSNAGSLNPHLYSPNQMFAQAMIYEPLVRYEEDGTVHPWLATSWEISQDGREYLFHLRTDVRFSDGTPFNAEAVKKNIDAILMNKERHRWLELINQLAKVKEAGGQAATVVDEYSVKITLKDPYYPILQELALPRPLRFLSPASIPDSGNTADGIKAPVGTGPWKVKELVKGEYDVFERNETYWGEKPKMKYLVNKVIPDSNARAVAFDTGEIDLIYGAGGAGGGQIGLDTFQRYQHAPEVSTSISKPISTRAMAINTNRLPTSDISVRKAILHAVNKPAIVEHIFLGVERPAATLFAPSMPYCDLRITSYDYSREKAATMLENAGWVLPENAEYRMKDGKELVVDLCFVGNDALQKSVAEVIQGDLRQVGIKVKLIGEEIDSFLNRQRVGEFGMIFGETWGAPYDPHSFCSSMRVPSHADYQAQLGLAAKKEIDAKIAEVLVSVDKDVRQQLYRDILATLHEQAVYLPLTYMTSIMVHSTSLEGTSFGPTKNEIPFEKMRKR